MATNSRVLRWIRIHKSTVIGGRGRTGNHLGLAHALCTDEVIGATHGNQFLVIVVKVIGHVLTLGLT